MSNTSSSNNDLNTKDIAVRVAVRVRPLVLKEVREGCQECLDVSYETPQVILRGTDKAFTFDYAFPSTTPQDYVYDKSVSKMVKELFKGYNVTILAYGQTGSGKTYSMGTSCLDMNENEMGIIPRAVKEIFNGILERTEDEILVKISFIELYKERVYDLLNTKTREETVVDIREDPRGGIKIVGLTEIPVTSLEEMMKCLEHGAMNRATGATAMNARSSRSHAIFSLHIEIGKKLESDNIISAKFHLVDLAGSERAKKTGATGERFKEGVNINKGLLALGNVISTLCGEGAKGHIPYRDSKLTRLLQDSLGGNSHTLMLACVSPADSNLEETLSTLRYADRARKIKNKPIVNRDPQAAELARLRQQVQQLQVQLISEKSAQESTFSPSSSEVNGLLSQMRILEEEDEKLMRALQTALDENTNMAEKALMAEMARDQLKTRLEELRAQTGNTVEILNKTLDVNANPQFNEQINLVKEIQKKIIDLQAEQYKRERAIVDHELSRHSVSNTGDGESLGEMTEVQEEGERGSPIKGEFGAAFTLRQAKLNEELQDLNRELAMKEELMTKMTANDVRFVAMKYSYERNLKEFEEQINHLQKEKEELMQKLRNAFHSNASNKISEQRRKRLQELEGLITGLKRKVGEQNKLLKIKEQSEQKVTKLSTEIQVAKLKEADRKKQYQIVKLERLHSKQQNVLKRKMEEAVAINKKLKDAMALQKACRERRTASKDIEGINGKIKCWLEGELEVVSVKKQAKKSLQTLMEDRKIISEQFTKLKCQLEKGEFPPLIQRELQNKKQNLESELQLRTAQISDMQMKMVEEDGDAQNKKRFDSVQTMVEAKCAMQFLFDAASEHQITVVSHESDIKELNSQYEEVCQNLQETETALKELKEEHQNELSRLSTEHEDKILFLLRQMPQTQETKTLEESSGNDASSDLLQRLKFQEEELSRLSHLHDLLQQKMEECEELQKRLQEAQTTLQTISTKAEKEKLDVGVKELTPTKMDHFPTPLRSIPKPLKVSRSESEDDSDDDDDDEEAQDKTVDPDWRKTPLYKRIRQITSRGRKWQEDDDDDVSKRSFEGEGVKRSSSGEVRCGCGKDCSSKICKCRKSGNACSLSCKCNALKCTNYKRNSSSTSDTSRETLLNSTFEVSLKKNEPLSEISINKKVRLDVSKGNKPQRTETENTDPLLSGVLAINIADLNFSMPPLWDSD